MVAVRDPRDGQHTEVMSPYCEAWLRLPIVGGQRERERWFPCGGCRWTEESEGTIRATPADTPALRGPEPATSDISSLAGELVVGDSSDTCRDNFTTNTLPHHDQSNQSTVNITLC